MLGCEVHLEVFQLDLQVPFMVHVFLRQEDGVAVVAGLPKNLDGDLNVEVDLAFAALFKNSVGQRQVCNIQSSICYYIIMNNMFHEGKLL